MEKLSGSVYRTVSQEHTLRAGTGAESGEARAVPTPEDTFAKGEPSLRNLSAQAGEILGPMTKEYAEAQKNAAMLTSTPVVTEKTAGWRAPLFDDGYRKEYERVDVAGGESMLFLPLKSNCNNKWGTTAMMHPVRGIIDAPDMEYFGQEYAQRITPSPDGTKTYVTNGISAHVKSFDENLGLLADVDLATFNSDFARIHRFTAGKHANYAITLSPRVTPDAPDRDHLVALDLTTGAPRWFKEVDHLHAIFEAPDGAVYAVANRKGRNFVHHFLPDGTEKGTMEFDSTPEGMVFRPDGSIIMSFENESMKIVNPSKLRPGRYQAAAMNTKNSYRRFQPSKDGKSFYGVDNGWSRNRLARINADTGRVEWEKDEGATSHLKDFRVINDEIYVLSDGRGTVYMRKYNADGKLLWEESAPLGELDQWHGPSITPRGDFVFGSQRSGFIYYMHPKKEGETEETIARELTRPQTMEDFLKDATARAQEASREEPVNAPAIEEDEVQLIIDGVKLKKKDAS